MISMSGRGKLTLDPQPTGDGPFIDITIEYRKSKWMRLTAKNYITILNCEHLEKGDTVYFSGMLDESEPGYYFVELSEVRKVEIQKRSKKK